MMWCDISIYLSIISTHLSIISIYHLDQSIYDVGTYLFEQAADGEETTTINSFRDALNHFIISKDLKKWIADVMERRERCIYTYTILIMHTYSMHTYIHTFILIYIHTYIHTHILNNGSKHTYIHHSHTSYINASKHKYRAINEQIMKWSIYINNLKLQYMYDYVLTHRSTIEYDHKIIHVQIKIDIDRLNLINVDNNDDDDDDYS